ncbi:MAG: nucleoside-diphosphate kinase [Crocinitomicaceae bacterium]|jgi:nucleoside-diphosphate kinase|nr:nucleoside-diphosphate kinase [Crocinitomicaceae bacterium]|tara:strand:- start:3916 stop:4326 length:411 start_codon:yes stop_codon:yes gene_type:complete
MTIQRTLSIIKPDAVAKNVIGEIISRFETNDLKIISAKLITLSDSEAGGFYAEHEGKPFYKDLIEFMTSGPVFIQVLEGDDAISKNRELMGNTDPSKADPGTIRADFAQTIDANAVHGSDSEKSAEREIAFFFSDL